MKLSGLVPMQALGMASRSHKLVKEAEQFYKSSLNQIKVIKNEQTSSSLKQ